MHRRSSTGLEYGQPQAQVTCPFMPQKCKFKPKLLPEALAASGRGETFGLDVLTKVFAVSPKPYRRNLTTALASAPDAARGQAAFTSAAAELLTEELRTWSFDVAAADERRALLAQLEL